MTSWIPTTKTTNIDSVKEKRFFPIQTSTACQSKWAWSSLFLNRGTSHSCHRASTSILTSENFNDFHNTDIKVSDRKLMLLGQWPQGGCTYCKNIETSGGFSDRMLHNTIPDLYPTELDADINSTVVSPTILEVFFDHTCNLSCVYCGPEISSKIADEYRKFGAFDQHGVQLIPAPATNTAELQQQFWLWMQTNFRSLKRFHFLGGEPFLQKEFSTLLEFIEANPNPDCEINFITNLMLPHGRFTEQIDRIKSLVARRKLKRLDMTASIDCWGPDQEYIRHGLNLDQWTQNFEYLLNQRWIKLQINQTISSLSIKTMPDLLVRLAQWNKVRPVGHFFSVTEPGPSYLRPNIFGPGVFDKDFDIILSLMSNGTDQERNAIKYMTGIANEIERSSTNEQEIKKLFVFLHENDRRRNTNWETLFPWLMEFQQHVV